MSRPGVVVTIAAEPARSGVPSDTGRLFGTGMFERGPVGTAVLVTSVPDAVATFGDRVSYSVAYDYLDAYFNSGGGDAYLSRVDGPAGDPATSTLVDKAGSPLVTLAVDALYEGDYGNRLARQVTAGSTSSLYTLIIFFDDVEVERFTDLASPAAGVTALAASAWVRGRDLASVTAAPNNIPAVAAKASLSGGTDDRASITDTHWTAALTAFGKSLGPGQVAAFGRTTTAAHAALLAHANNNNRTALLDAADLASASSLVATRLTDSAATGADHGALFAPWLVIPGLATGLTRTVPASAVVAGLIASSDVSRSTNEAAAGTRWGVSQYALRLSGTPFTDAELDTLEAGHVNPFRVGPSGPMLYDFQTVSSNAAWDQLNWARLRMELQAQLTDAGERFLFRQITPETIGDFKGALMAVFAAHFQEGALYGARPEDAFDVNVGGAVNTPVTIAAGELHAQCWAKFSATARHVFIVTTKALIAA